MLAAIGAAMAIGTAYSVPPLHLKRSAAASAAAIALVRGPIVNLGVFSHFQQAAGSPPAPTTAALLVTLVVTCFGVAVAVAKDVPDEAGDRVFGMGTLTVRQGPRVALATSVGVLSIGLAMGSVAAGLALSPAQALGFIATQCLILTGLALLLRRTVARGATMRERPSHGGEPVDAVAREHESALSKEASGRFYRGLWRLLYLEYVALPAVLLVGAGVR
jgi:homogentisate phytyltransferase/homogentisate geranylgeranyltransferase